jgi:hypothetical protein
MNQLPAALAFLAAAFSLAQAQAPASAPTGTTAICRDGTFTSAPSKDGACRGHKGVQTWYAAAPTPNPEPVSAPPKSIPGSGPAAVAAKHPQAPGATPNLVWLNTGSNVYHCPDSAFYGRTKAGSYVTESDARAKGAHPAHNHPCGK